MLNNPHFFKELLLYSLHGLVTVGIAFAVMLALKMLGLSSLLANALGFILGSIYSYSMNGLQTFKSSLTTRNLILFLSCYLFVLIIHSFLFVTLSIWLEPYKLNESLAFFIATAISAVMNFTLMKNIVFKQQVKQHDANRGGLRKQDHMLR